MVNETINATINATISSLDIVKETLQQKIAPRLIELMQAPYNHANLLWIAIPLVVSLVMMDLYFGRYKKEELGWNTAVGNSLALMFVAMDLFRHLYNSLPEPSFINLVLSDYKGILVVFFLSFGSLWLLVAEFFHILPKRLAFLISSSFPTSMFAYLAIILIYTEIPLDIYTVFAAFLMSILLFAILKLIYFLIPTYYTKEEAQAILAKKKAK